MCYSFRKKDIPFEAWLEKIDQIVVPADPGAAPEGTWREMLSSSMLRQADDGDEGGYAAKFLTEGSIRGVLVAEEENDIEIKLHSFASRSDQYLAARMAWEAMHLGASVEKEGYGKIEAESLSAEAVEATHRDWFSFSKASIRQEGEHKLPIFNFLALKIESGDSAKTDEVLETELIERLAAFGDAFISSRMVIGIDGVGQKTVGILQPELHSLMEKDVEGVAMEGNIVPMESFLEALGSLALDGDGCWVFPPASKIDPAILQSLAGKGFTPGGGGSTATGGPTEDEWNFIAQGPVLAFLLVAASDGKVDKKEVESFGKVLNGLAAQQENAAVARMMRTTAEQFHEILPRLLSGKTNPAHVMQALTMLINDRFSPEDSKLMKASLLFLAHQVAASSGGFLGMGPKISKDEKMALAALAGMLGLIEQ